MTVKELIEKLEKFDPDKEVVIADSRFVNNIHPILYDAYKDDSWTSTPHFVPCVHIVAGHQQDSKVSVSEFNWWMNGGDDDEEDSE